MKDKPNSAVEEDTEEMRKWRSLGQGEINGPVLEKFWRRKWKNKSWTCARSKKAKERPSEVEVLPGNGGGCAKTKNTE